MFTFIWLIFMGNVGNHTCAGPMDPLGILCVLQSWLSSKQSFAKAKLRRKKSAKSSNC